MAYLNESLEENNKEHYKLDYVDRTGIEDFKTTKSNYSSIIYSIAEEYGIDPQIMLAIATQESIIHREYTGGSAVGLMQIELSAWNEENIIAHNFRTGENETIHITLDKLNDLESNIRIACMIFQNYLIESNYNLEVAIQMYNYGPGNISKTIRACYGNDVDLKELLKNYDNEWLKYRVFINQGDSEYLEHVMSYVEDANDIKCVDLNNNIHSYSFGNYNKTL